MNLNGIYRGFAPTDESDIGLGELEVTINDDELSYRWATGTQIQSEAMPRSLFRQITAAELASRFKPEADLTDLTGYVLGEDGPLFLFVAENIHPPGTPRVLVMLFFSQEIDELFGPVYLFTPDQVEAGYFEQAVSEIEAHNNVTGAIPRLANDGRRT
jgi:hypothetical protein